MRNNQFVKLVGLLPASFLAVRNNMTFFVDTRKVSGSKAADDFPLPYLPLRTVIARRIAPKQTKGNYYKFLISHAKVFTNYYK